MVRFRTQRLGRRNRLFSRIQFRKGRTRRDGASIEQVGWYDPISKDPAKQLNLNEERIKYWVEKGAQPSDTVCDMLAKRNLIGPKAMAAWEARRARDRKRVEDAKAAATAAAAAAAVPAEAEKKPE